MSMISEQISRLKEKAVATAGVSRELLDAADTIEALSAKLAAANMERSSAYYNGGWIPCSERLPEERGLYLVTARIYFTPDHVDETDNYIGVKIGIYFDRFGWEDPETFAWMPLPKPYIRRLRTCINVAEHVSTTITNQ